MTGLATVVGNAGVDIRNHGASWSAVEGAVVLLDGAQDRVFRVDVRTGRADAIVDAQFDFSTVGFEVDPGSNRMFACTGDAVLYEIDPRSGAVSAVRPLGHDGNCGNLAAPRGRVACIDD